MRNERPEEKEAVRTTIVGGRPPGCGTDLGAVPRGIEVLVKKAAVDEAFRAELLDRRADVARDIELALDAAEAAMLNGIPRDHLERIIAGTQVHESARGALLGKVAAVMMAALGLAAGGCRSEPLTLGIRPEKPGVVEAEEGEKPDGADEPDAKPAPTQRPDKVTRGVRPDRPRPKPDRDPGATKGLRPDRP